MNEIKSSNIRSEIFQKDFYDHLRQSILATLLPIQHIRHLELYATAQRTTRIEFEQGEMKIAEQKQGGGIGLRAVDSQGRQGMTYTSDFTQAAIKLISRQVVAMMKAATPDPDFLDLVHPADHYTFVDGIYDPTLKTLTLEEINTLLSPFYSLKKRTPKPHSLSGGLTVADGVCYIWNSNNVDLWENHSAVGVSAEVSLSPSSGTPSSGFNWQHACHMKDLNVSKVADTAYQMAYRGMKKTDIPTGVYPLILSPLAVATFLISPLTEALNAEAVQNQMSFLGSALHEPLFPSFISIQDDPHIPHQIGSESFDAEGTSTRPTVIIDKGVLTTFYHNSYTAHKANLESNGHATRANYSSPIGIGNTNIVISNVNSSPAMDDMIAEIPKGIYFEYTGDSPNLITGDFSGLIMTGYVIDKGVIGPALKEALLGINLRDAFQKINVISKEQEWINEMHVPWMRINDVTVSGRST